MYSRAQGEQQRSQGQQHLQQQQQQPHRMRSNQVHQIGYAIGEQGDGSTPSTVNPSPLGPTYSKFGSPFDDGRQTETAFGSYIPAPSPSVAGGRLPSSTSAPNFSPGNGPLLLNGEKRKGPSSNLPYVSNSAAFNKSSANATQGVADRGVLMTQQLEGVSNKTEPLNVGRQPTIAQRYREMEQEAMTPADDVVMQDEQGPEEDETSFYPVKGVEDEEEFGEEFDEEEYAYVTGPPHRRQSAPNTREIDSLRQDYISDMASQADNFEPAWADDASCIDGGDHPIPSRFPPPPHREPRNQTVSKAREETMTRAKSPVEETFEVAALRRQVEQLQMALKKQMVTADRPKGRGPTPSQYPQQVPPSSHISARSSAGVRYPFGMPSPDPSRDSSMVSSRKMASTKYGYRDYYSGDSNYVDHYHANQTPPGYNQPIDQQSFYPDRRQYHPAPHMQAQQQSDMDDYRRMIHHRQRVTSDPPTLSSLLADESASAFVRGDESSRMEELAKKIDALERMFQTSSTISPPHSDTGSQNQQVQAQSNSQSSQYIHRPSLQSGTQRTPSLSTISTRDGTYGRSRSPAASAFNYNATPYSRANPSSDHGVDSSQGHHPTGQHDNTSSSSVNRRKKGVARFIMGVSGSRGNVPRDENGNPLPTMQVSWSRKRTEKVVKPATPAVKMKVGPGRGRMVMKPAAPSS